MRKVIDRALLRTYTAKYLARGKSPHNAESAAWAMAYKKAKWA